MGEIKGDGSKSDGYQKIDLPKGGSVEVLGVDVSHYQGNVNWSELYELGYRFAYAKATDGAHGVDSMFQKHKAGAKAAGLLFGAYHFFRFPQDIPEQVKNFLTVAGTVEPGELPHAIDAEWDRTSQKYCEGHEMDAEAADMIFTMATLVGHSIKMLPVIYTNAYFFNPGTRGSSFAQMPLWVPSYASKTIQGVKIPKPWASANIWQYSEHLNIGGVSAIDGNKFQGSFEELKALVKK